MAAKAPTFSAVVKGVGSEPVRMAGSAAPCIGAEQPEMGAPSADPARYDPTTVAWRSQ